MLSACNSSSTSPPFVPAPPVPVDNSVASFQSKINHIIVLYNENWAFDALYGNFPGANGYNNVASTKQVYCTITGGVPTYAPLSALPASFQAPPPAAGCTWDPTKGKADPNIASSGLAPAPYNLKNFVPPNYVTGDILHRFWHQQLAIDNGKLDTAAGPGGLYSNDKYVTWEDNQGLVLSYFDATNLPEGQLAQQYTLADNFYHSAYGGSFLNHQWLICACTPAYNGPAPAASAVSSWNAATETLNDGTLTTLPIGGTGQLYAVNTIQPPYAPTGSTTFFLPPLSNKTIGDLLTDNSPSISWKWYSGGWSGALANPALVYAPPLQFQPHHQPFNYYARWGTGGATAGSHLADETQFFSDLSGGTLPNVTFIKPVGVNNSHPGYADLLSGQNHTQSIVQAVQNSPYWKDTAIIITYDEYGGRWDHASPPATTDGWGPGGRVPAVIISPFSRKGYVDHTQYETVSILKTIETRWNLPSLGTRDAAASNLLNAFDFNQPTPASKARSASARSNAGHPAAALSSNRQS